MILNKLRREGYTGKLELHAIVGYKGKLELHTQPIKNTRGHPEVTHLPKVTSSSSSLSEKVKSLRPIFVESRNQEANSAVDCSSIHRVAIVFHSNSSLVIGSSSEHSLQRSDIHILHIIGKSQKIWKLPYFNKYIS